MSAVLATLSGSYPPLEGRSPTCYSAVRHCPRPERRGPFDLHVLGTPPAFILSQDQTLHRNCPRSILPYRTNGFLKRSLNRSSRSPPLFDCQRAPRVRRLTTAWMTRPETPDLSVWQVEQKRVKGGPGTGRLSHAVAHAVSLALGRFTTVFGKGTGGTTPRTPPGPRLGPQASGPAASRVQHPAPGASGERAMSTRGRRPRRPCGG